MALDPKYPNTYSNMAAIYLKKGDKKSQLKYLLKGYEALPDNLIINENLLNFYTDMKDMEKMNFYALHIQEIQIQELFN
jgi:Flp pilus assembly protein TadD